MESSYYTVDKFIKKLNDERLDNGTVEVGELKITTPGIIRKQFDSISDTIDKLYGRAPLLRESEEIGNIKLSRGIMYKEGENHKYFSKLLLNIDKFIELTSGQIPKCEIEFYKEYDFQSGEIFMLTTNYTTNNGKYTSSHVKEILPITLFTTTDKDSEIAKFWQISIEYNLE